MALKEKKPRKYKYSKDRLKQLEATMEGARELRWIELEAQRKALGAKQMDPEAKEALRKGKRDLARVLAEHGVPGVCEIIKRGPYAGRVVEKNGERVELDWTESDGRRWEYAMSFAADRAGMPRITDLSLSATEGVPPIEVRLQGFKRPDDQ